MPSCLFCRCWTTPRKHNCIYANIFQTGTKYRLIFTALRVRTLTILHAHRLRTRRQTLSHFYSIARTCTHNSIVYIHSQYYMRIVCKRDVRHCLIFTPSHVHALIIVHAHHFKTRGQILVLFVRGQILVLFYVVKY